MDVESQAENVGDGNVNKEHLFPSGYTYIISKDQLEIAEVKDHDSAEEWIAAYSRKSNTTWRINRTYKASVKRILKQDWRCHHNVQQAKANPTKVKKKRYSKNLNCPAKLQIKITRLSEKKAIQTEMQSIKCIVKHNLEHNHPLNTAAVLKCHPLHHETYEAGNREIEESNRRRRPTEQQRDEASGKISELQKQIEDLCGGPFLHAVRISELDTLPIPELKELQEQLRENLKKVDKVVFYRTSTACMMCEKQNRSVTLVPCNHFVLCNKCTNHQKNCPYCNEEILHFQI